MSDIILPAYDWEPRLAQLPIWRAFIKSGFRDFRGSIIAHRRFGKDEISLQLVLQAMLERPGTYLYCFPSYSQARKSMWQSVNPRTGRRRIDEVFIKEIRAKTRENEMQIVLKNGSTIQFVGSDSARDSLVGGSPVMIVFSEWALSNPQAWAFLSPVLMDNHGNALFIGTPRGKNHAYQMHQHAATDPKWFSYTCSSTDNPDFDPEIIEQTRKEYTSLFGVDMANSLINQEYYVDFNSAVIGSYYASIMGDLEKKGHINDNIVIDHDRPIHVAWDVGISDMMSLTVFQVYLDRIHVIDYLENSGKGFQFYVDWLVERGYTNRSGGVDYVPHDIKKREFDSTGGVKTRIDHLIALDRNPKLVPNESVADGINAVRLTLPRCYFHKTNCARLVECLVEYRAEWDETNSIFKNRPEHSWASHGSDSFRYFALAVRQPYTPPVEILKPQNLPLNRLTYDQLLEDENLNAWKIERI